MWCAVGVACLAIVGCGGASSRRGSGETGGAATGIAGFPPGPYAYAVDGDPLSRVAHIRSFVAPAGAGQPREITNLPGLVKDPVLTADRRRLAYLVIDPKAKTSDIRMQNIDGSSDRRVLLLHRGVYGLAIAPDGSSLVASMAPPADDRDKLAVYLYEINLHTGRLGRVTNDRIKGVDELDPAYAGARRLVYRRFADERTAGDIYTARLGGTTPRKLIATPRDEAQPRMSPDGKTLLYDVGAYGTDANTGVAVASADGSGAHPLFKPPPAHAMNYAAWTPDGKEIVASYDIDERFPEPQNSVKELYAMRPDGRGLRRLTHTKGSELGVDFGATPAAP
jgi:Tol biopolymer transport system component